MKRLLKNLSLGSAHSSTSARRSFRPTCECLEDRDVLSTLFLVPNSVPPDATHFHNFQGAYQAATVGDVIQVEPNASVASVGKGVIGHRIAGGAVSTNTITIDNAKIGAGEWVTVNGGGGSSESALVLAAQPSGKGDVTLSFTANLAFNHTGSGATVTTLGRLGIVKAITLQGDPNHGPGAVTSPLESPPGTANLIFNHLDFTAAQGLTIDANHQGITVENSTLPFLALNIGTGNANDLITGDRFSGSVIVNGDGAGLTADTVTNNTFTGSASLYMINNGDAAACNNVFNVAANPNVFAVATIVNCPSILLYKNSITVSSATPSSTALALWYTSSYPQSMLAFVEDNAFKTGGTGVGLNLTGPLEAMIEGNDFRHNAVGVFMTGDGNTIGTVDLGGGPLGSQGGNNFSTFTAAGAAAGHFAITLHHTSASDQVYAFANVWSVSNPWNLVKDSYEHTNAKEAVYAGVTTPGTGEIIFTITISMDSPLHLDPHAVLMAA